MLQAAITGYATAISLILAIGAQNAFVLRQGLRREHVFWICTFCAVSDAALILAGILGFGAIVHTLPDFPMYLAIAGAIFLFCYGALRFRAAVSGDALELEGKGAQSLKSALLACFAFTWLNPHVYLDTVGLIGSVSTQFEGQNKLAFGVAACAASLSFFFSLGYGARFLAPYLTTRRSWAILDFAIGALMWLLALWLIQSALTSDH